jgi:hypothetical protein
MSEYASQVVNNYANGYKGTEAFFGQVDWFDVGVSAITGGASVYVAWIRYVEPWVTNAVDWKGNGDFITVFGSNRDNPTKDFGMYLGDSFLESGSIIVTDVVQWGFDTNWGKKSTMSFEDLIKTPKGLKELNNMSTQDLLNKASRELGKELLWGFGQNALSNMGQTGFKNEYSERQQQDSYKYPYSMPYNKIIDYSPSKDVRKSKNRQYEMLIQALSLKK